MSDEVEVKKSASTPSTPVPKTVEVGQPRVATSARLIQDAKKEELSINRRLDTFDSMLSDSDVFTASNYSILFAVKSLAKGEVVSRSGTQTSILAADFINYCLHNMGYGTWWDAVGNMTTALKYGWSDLNIVLEKKKYGKWKGNFTIRKLSPRSPHSVYGWLWDDNFTEWKGLVQKPSLTQNSRPIGSKLEDGISLLAVPKFYERQYPVIEAANLIHTSYNTTMENPQGDSPLLHCFEDWYEKKLIQNFEVAGISKDLNGLPVLRVPSELVEKASNPDDYPLEAMEYVRLQQDMADLHQGRTTHMVLTSDADPIGGKYLYDFQLIGIQGGGKNFNTSEIINQRRKSIYNVFGAGHLLLGQSSGSGGSYALSTSQTGMHGHLIERDILQYTNIINTQLIPRLLAANGVFLDYKDMPVFVPAEPDELSLDELSKSVQRMAATRKLTPAVLKELLRLSGLPTEGVDDLDFDDRGESRSGDGMEVGMGNGTSSEVAEYDTSSGNMENKMMNIVADRNTDRLVDVETGECINEDDLDNKGYYR